MADMPVSPTRKTSAANGGNVGWKMFGGLVAGAVGVWAMDRVDWFMWNRESSETQARTTAVRPGGEPPAQVLVSRIEDATGKHPAPAAHQAAGQAVHYSIGIAPALGYALLRDRLPVSGVARGALYGAGLFLTQDEALNAATGLGAKPQDYPWQAHARGLVAHAVYGIVTELTLNTLERLAGNDGPAPKGIGNRPG